MKGGKGFCGGLVCPIASNSYLVLDKLPPEYDSRVKLMCLNEGYFLFYLGLVRPQHYGVIGSNTVDARAPPFSLSKQFLNMSLFFSRKMCEGGAPGVHFICTIFVT